ncbi:MAG: antitoxin [Candidatus Dormiibacterota bacterium]
MADVLVRHEPDHVVMALDARAGRLGLGLSRSEYLRRWFAQEATIPEVSVSADDLIRFSQVFADLADPEVTSQAWQ